jgi:hypothetical protein
MRTCHELSEEYQTAPLVKQELLQPKFSTPALMLWIVNLPKKDTRQLNDKFHFLFFFSSSFFFLFLYFYVYLYLFLPLWVFAKLVPTFNWTKIHSHEVQCIHPVPITAQ